MAKSKARSERDKLERQGKATTREETCAMQVVDIAGAPPRHIMRCTRHGQIKHRPPTFPGVTLPNDCGTYPAGSVGWKLMRLDFQAHREGR